MLVEEQEGGYEPIRGENERGSLQIVTHYDIDDPCPLISISLFVHSSFKISITCL
jgi:hypothetical protein